MLVIHLEGEQPWASQYRSNPLELVSWLKKISEWYTWVNYTNILYEDNGFKAKILVYFNIFTYFISRKLPRCFQIIKFSISGLSSFCKMPGCALKKKIKLYGIGRLKISSGLFAAYLTIILRVSYKLYLIYVLLNLESIPLSWSIDIVLALCL
jgi:hypothetical protein